MKDFEDAFTVAFKSFVMILAKARLNNMEITESLIEAYYAKADIDTFF